MPGCISDVLTNCRMYGTVGCMQVTPDPVKDVLDVLRFRRMNSSGTPISCILKYMEYSMYIPCISCCPDSTRIDIHGISIMMDIHGYTMYIQGGGYTWYIHGYPCISIMYIPRIYMDIHGISIDVYPWYIRGISVDIHRFLNPDFSSGPCCWSHSMRTQVCVIRVFHSTRHHGNGARG